MLARASSPKSEERVMDAFADSLITSDYASHEAKQKINAGAKGGRV